MRNNSGFGMWLEACDYGGPAPTNIDHNSVTGNGGDGIPDCPATIQNNTVRNNALAGPNSVGFNAVGIDVVGSDGVTFTRNDVTRSTVVDRRVDDETLHTFTANACSSEEPKGAWD